MNRDLEVLSEYERSIMKMEEDVLRGKTEHFQENIMPLRRKNLTLRGYYDEIMDMGKEWEENENLFFVKKTIIHDFLPIDFDYELVWNEF